jgi:hypothetical protein
MLNKLAEIYNRQDIVDVYKYGVFNYINYFDLLSRFKIDEYKSYQLRTIKRRSCVINHTNRIEYHIDNKLHRDNDKPAVEWSDGTISWWQYGTRHRNNDNPAVEWADGTKLWWQNGELHRDNDKPAVELADGAKEWYQNGKIHRDNNKPAIEYANGTKSWYQNDKFIRSSEN